ncbi:MAG: hypothetical protein Q7J09_07640 [Methanocalculus sp.]|uniref:hypothetical protein n=1 Tax=Methanocalculus sp. TaxID=2004547 RepID=UPI00271A3C79|nr:hypothetical protein [Methanocalculus sp.]MDO9539857.1 hypothetical protein [Methanocalculus sp.]
MERSVYRMEDRVMIGRTKIGIIIILLTILACQGVAAGHYEYLNQFGSAGPGQMDHPWGIALSGADIFVVNEYLHNTRIFGNYGGTYDGAFGNFGSAAGQMKYPRGVAVDAFGYVYVADAHNHRVQKFTSDGVYVTGWGSYGSGVGQLNEPSGIAVDSAGYIYVVDAQNHRVQVFTNVGSHIRTITGNFNNPQGIAVANSYVYVTEYGNNRVSIFGDYGSTLIGNFGSAGSGDGEFFRPHGIAVDSAGYLYVADTNNHRVQKFTSGGVFVEAFGTPGTGDGEFNAPRDIVVLESINGQRVYVSDWNNNRVQVWRTYSQPSGGTGGRSSMPVARSIGTATLLTNTLGQVLQEIQLDSVSRKGRFTIDVGVYALDRDGKRLSGITMNDLPAAGLPHVPQAGTFAFAGYAVLCSPAGATFSPSAQLTFSFTDAEWSLLMAQTHQTPGYLVVKWYDQDSGVWVNLPTTVNTQDRTVSARVAHFTGFALFSDTAVSSVVTPAPEPIVTPVPTPVVPQVPTTPIPPTPDMPVTPEEPVSGFPWIYILIGVVIILIAGGAYYYSSVKRN